MMICVPYIACVRMFFWGYDFIVCCCSRVRCGRGKRCRPRACAYCHAHTFCMNCTVSVVWFVPVHVRRNRVVGRLWATTSRGSVYYSCRFAGIVSAELLHNVRSGYLLVLADTSRTPAVENRSAPDFSTFFSFRFFTSEHVRC